MKIVLKNNTSYEILDSSTENVIHIETELSNIELIKNTLTEENLSVYKFTTDTDELISEWQNKKLDHLEYSGNVASFIFSNVDIQEKGQKSLQDQIDEITYTIIPEILGLIDILMNGGEV